MSAQLCTGCASLRPCAAKRAPITAHQAATFRHTGNCIVVLKANMATSAVKRPMWLDCDPGAKGPWQLHAEPARPALVLTSHVPAGHDDAIALMLASTHPELELLGVSTVACNQTVEKTTINAMAVLHACGAGHVPVHCGQPKPLMRSPPLCKEIHGDTGASDTLSLFLTSASWRQV
jgi:hypothetical protein